MGFLYAAIAIAALAGAGWLLWRRLASPAPAPTGSRAGTSGRKRLDNLTNDEIREIGGRYGLYITGQVGTSTGRIAVLMLYVVVCFFLARFAAKYALGLFHVESSYQYWLLATALFALAVGVGLSQWFLVSVPKLTGLITTNYFTKELHVYDVGWSIKFPWESYTLSDYIDLQADIVEKLSTFVTKERVPVSFKWTSQFRPYLRLLPVYVSTENQAIEQGLEEVVESVIAVSITDVAVDEIKDPKTLKLLRENLARALEGDIIGGDTPILDEEGNTIEERFGINIELVTFSPPEFAKDYQEALTASKTFETITQNAKALNRDLGIDGKAAFDRVLVANKENVEVKVSSFEAGQNVIDAIKDVGQSIAAAIAGVFSPRPPTPPTGGTPPTPPPSGSPPPSGTPPAAPPAAGGGSSPTGAPPPRTLRPRSAPAPRRAIPALTTPPANPGGTP